MIQCWNKGRIHRYPKLVPAPIPIIISCFPVSPNGATIYWVTQARDLEVIIHMFLFEHHHVLIWPSPYYLSRLPFHLSSLRASFMGKGLMQSHRKLHSKGLLMWHLLLCRQGRLDSFNFNFEFVCYKWSPRDKGEFMGSGMGSREGGEVGGS